MKKTICFICHKKCNLQCSKCRCIGYCDAKCQLKDWPNHKKWCETLINASRNKYIPLFHRRKEIILTSDRNKQEMLMHELLFDLKKRLHSIKNLMPTSFTLTSEAKIFMLYDYSEEYICSILLIVRIYLSRNDKANAKKALTFLYSEWEKECQRNKFDEYFINRPGVIAMNKNYKNYKIYLNRYLRLYSSCIMCACEIENQHLVMFSMMLYLKVLEGLAINTRIYESFCPWTAMILGKFFLIKSNPTVAISLYDCAAKYLMGKTSGTPFFNQIFEDIFQLNLNSALVNYSLDSRDKTMAKLNDCLFAINEWTNILEEYYTEKKEYDQEEKNSKLLYINEKLLLVYQTKAELEKSFENFYGALENIYQYTSLAKRLNLGEETEELNCNILQLLVSIEKNTSRADNKSLKKIGSKELESPTSTIHPIKKKSTLMGIHVSKKQKKKEKIMDKTDYVDFNNLFLFLSKLSTYQLMLLNQTQPKMNYTSFINLPIHFSDIFKSSLTYEQRTMLVDINGMNLTRKKFLVDPSQPISFSNLKFCDFYPDIVNGSTAYAKKKQSYHKLIESMKKFSSLNVNFDSNQQEQEEELELIEKEKDNKKEKIKRIFEKSEFYFGEYKDDFFAIKKSLTDYIVKNKILFRKDYEQEICNGLFGDGEEEKDNLLEIGEEDDDLIMMIIKEMTLEERKDLIKNPQLIINAILEKRNEIKEISQNSTIVSFSQG